MRNAIILMLLSIATCQVFGHHTVEKAKGYTEGEWTQILKGGLGHCSTPGEPCFTGKRVALAVAKAIAFPDPQGRAGFCSDSSVSRAEAHYAEAELRLKTRGRLGFCSVPTMECARKGDALDKIGRAVEKVHYTIWVREAEAEAAAQAAARHTPLMGFCSVVGMACVGNRDLESRSGGVGWCSTKESCVASRAAIPEADAVRGPAANATDGSCNIPGMVCSREIEARRKAPKMGWCSVPGMACMNERNAEDQPSDTVWCSTTGLKCSDRRRDLDARLPSDKRFAFCGVPGSTCTEKREIDDFEQLSLSLEEGQQQTKVVRDLIDGLRILDPDFDKRECYAEHGPCSEILKARDAFEHIKNDRNWNQKESEPTGEDITKPAHAHLSISHLTIAREAEVSCYGPGGACTDAKRAIDELETAINDAMALL